MWRSVHGGAGERAVDAARFEPLVSGTAPAAER